MTLYRNSFDAGPDGAGVNATSGNSGDAFTYAEPGLTFSSTRAAHGPLSGQSATGGTTSVARWGIADTGQVSVRLYLWLDNPAANDQGIIRLSDTSNGTVSQLILNMGNQARVLAKSSTVWTATPTFPTAQWVRVEMTVDQGASTSSGTVRVAYYLGESTTPEVDTGPLTGLDLGGGVAPINNVRIGKNSGNSITGHWYIDTLAVNTGPDVNGFIGPHATTEPINRWGRSGSSWVPMRAYPIA